MRRRRRGRWRKLGRITIVPSPLPSTRSSFLDNGDDDEDLEDRCDDFNGTNDDDFNGAHNDDDCNGTNYDKFNGANEDDDFNGDDNVDARPRWHQTRSHGS